MTGEAQGVLVAVTGVVAVRLAVTDAYLSYLKEGMRWPLLVAGLVLTVLGLLTIVRAFRTGDGSDAGSDAEPHAEDARVHEHEHGGPRVAWLLVLPLLAILLVAPAPLGAYAASRESNRTIVVPESNPVFDPLPAVAGSAVPITLSEFITRSYYDENDSLAGVPIRLTGFVVADPEVPDGYQLTRFTLACCAADAFPMQVAVRGVEAPIPANDTWVEVTGTWIEPPPGTEVGVDRGAELELSSAVVVEQPTNPYE